VDLIISDIDMPKMDGLEFLRWLGRIAPRTAILIHSVLDQTLLRSVEAMAVEYGLTPIGLLEDPITVDSLTIALERAQLHFPKDWNKEPPLVSRSEVEEGVRQKEFEPWFQPKIDIASGRVIGVEALLRWRRNDHVLLPARFVPVLEEAGLLMECTLRVAARAAECITMILDKEKEFTVAINVTPMLLDDPNFARALSTALVGSGARPEHIVIEVTETAMAQNQGAMLENLARLRMDGFGISLDDFCTGYSSMARLARSPFSEIKIDRTFVGRMYPGNREWLMIESTVALARSLGLHTVAEGVENEHQLDALKRFGCNSAQGFLIARPMPILELMHWIERDRVPSQEFGSTSQLVVTYS
jgi:EAL domain-containing protein (putative c-di-GMP-specific phosphodiesterase class I)